MLTLKRMGVMNVTPNSFSDGGSISGTDSFKSKLKSFGNVDAIDIGAESTAPMNQSIFWEEEWERLLPFIPFILESEVTISLDTYHPETIDQFLKVWKDQNCKRPIIWNDVSGKFDHFAKAFLKYDPSFTYIFCHNLAPLRELSGKHMEYKWSSEGEDFLNELASYFRGRIHPQVIFDPCLGFSKTYEQNWYILDHFHELQKKTGHDRWLLGFSRKSFLRKKFNLEIDQRDELDRVHGELLSKIKMDGEVWIRTHRPELL